MLLMPSSCIEHDACRDAAPLHMQSPAQFLQQHAAERAARRRDAAAVQLQRFWRGVVAAAASTRQLALAFVDTGLPRGQREPAADAAAYEEAPQQVLGL
jgi:hypothetical protein